MFVSTFSIPKLLHNKYMKNSFPKNLKELRLTNNMTQAQVAEKLKTTQRKVSYWESSKIEPDLDTLISIAEFFDVSIDELVGRPF